MNQNHCHHALSYLASNTDTCSMNGMNKAQELCRINVVTTFHYLNLKYNTIKTFKKYIFALKTTQIATYHSQYCTGDGAVLPEE